MAKKTDELLALFHSGRYDKAEQLAKKIIAKTPSSGLAWKVLAAAISLQGRRMDSLAPMQKTVELSPRDAEAHNNLGVTLQELGRLAEAEASHRRALEINPEYAEAHSNLGNALKGLGRLNEAETSYRRALEIKPQFAQAHSNLGIVLKWLGRLDEAEAGCRRALEINPNFSEALCNLGNILNNLGRCAEAESCYRRALEIKPDYVEAHSNLGITLKELGRLDEAVASFRRALEIKPEYAEALSNLGITLKDLGRLDEAEACYRRALEIRPDYVEAHSNLGVTLKDLGRHDEAEASYRRALEIKPDCLEARDNLLFSICYHPTHDPLELYEEACAYGKAVGSLATQRFSGWLCDTGPKRLRVGLVSGDLRDHSVGLFLEGILARINRSALDVIAYPTSNKTSELTARLKTHFSAWRPLVGLSDRAAAELIHSDRVHILIDLSGHTAHNRLPVFAWKPAPIQVTWLGFWATTGVREIDYILVDETGVPPGQASTFTERPWYLPHTRLCFTPPDGAPQTATLPALEAPEREVTLGCFQTLPKINDRTLSLWGRVLTLIPGSRLRWQCKQFDDPTVVRSTLQRLARLGIDTSRVRLPGKMPRDRYLAAYAEVDVILDSFPFPGGTTTCEALWMGVPTLTLAGDSMLARQGASLLSAAGLPEWIATSEDDFVAKAVDLLGSSKALAGLAELRGGLRARVAASPLFDAGRFAGDLEAALWGMWERRQADRNSPAPPPDPHRAEFPAADAPPLKADSSPAPVSPGTVRTFLHVGCGLKHKDRSTGTFAGEKWREVRLDIDPAVEPDLIGTMLDMSAVGTGSVDAVFSSHNIEHLHPHEVPLALAEFKRVLSPDGFLVITCPDLQSVCALVAQDKLTDAAYQSARGPIAPIDIIYGHRPPLAEGNLFMAHRCGFTQKTLTDTLQAAGFSSVASIKRGHPFYDLWAVATVGRIGEPDIRRLVADHFPKQSMPGRD